MSKNHHLSHLTFYGVAISSVLVLFKIVSAYGETQLKAPNNFTGNYIVSVDRLPDCLTQNTLGLELNLQQSGIYLFSELTLKQKQPPNITISLDGKITDERLILQGKLPTIENCNFPEKSLVTLKAGEDKDSISGQLTLGKELEFQGDKLPSKPVENSH
jgi:hypothetical protein